MNKFEPKQRESVIESFRVPSTLDFKPMVLLESKELRYVNGWSMQVWILTQRSYIIVRAGLLTKESVALYLGLSAIAGMLWLDVGTHEDDIFPRTTLALWMIGTWMFFPVFDSLALFSKGKDSLKKELHVNSYRLSAYFVSQTTAALMPMIFWCTVWMSIVYCFTLAPTGYVVLFDGSRSKSAHPVPRTSLTTPANDQGFYTFYHPVRLDCPGADVHAKPGSCHFSGHQ